MIRLEAVGRTYSTGATEVHALRQVSLEIQSGEMVAIVGASGSGKSSLMNLLGCLDVPSQGEMYVDGVSAKQLGLDELAALRRHRFGFIFQRYHLINEQDALANVSMPAIYAGIPAAQRGARATELLTRLGLAERLTHRPHELSGGQQQRVSVARALMNGGQIVLADEPTGALDSHSGRDMMALLLELNQRGHTVIIVTHDPLVAAHAPRLIKLEDGCVVSDSGWPASQPRVTFTPPAPAAATRWTGALRPAAQARDAMLMAWTALSRHRLRTALSSLGIGIGIAAVVGVMALGDAMRASVDNTLRGFLSNKLVLTSGSPALGPGVEPKSFSEEDVRALRELAQVTSVRPKYETYVVARQGKKAKGLTVLGLAPKDLGHEGFSLQQGRGLSDEDRLARNQVMVLTPSTVRHFFAEGDDPLGKTMLLGELPFEVIGVTAEASPRNDMANWGNSAFVPDSTLLVKMLGQRDVQQLFIYLHEGASPLEVQGKVTQVMERRHGQVDFSVYNREQEFRQAGQASNTMRWVLTAIASISLLVGGVGVMNMMLVAVSERKAEIGIRMAVGARPVDVQTQFLIEALVLCGIGSLLGLALSWWVILGINLFQSELQAELSWPAMALAFSVSSAIGLGFGLVPARQAARLSPVAALSRE